jgi:hypothetical protein
MPKMIAKTHPTTMKEAVLPRPWLVPVVPWKWECG